MLIPYQSLDSETLHNLVESFLLREETDYGEAEVSLETKSQAMLKQIKKGEIVILYSELSESVTFIDKQQFNAQMQEK